MGSARGLGTDPHGHKGSTSIVKPFSMLFKTAFSCHLQDFTSGLQSDLGTSYALKEHQYTYGASPAESEVRAVLYARRNGMCMQNCPVNEVK